MRKRFCPGFSPASPLPLTRKSCAAVAAPKGFRCVMGSLPLPLPLPLLTANCLRCRGLSATTRPSTPSRTARRRPRQRRKRQRRRSARGGQQQAHTRSDSPAPAYRRAACAPSCRTSSDTCAPRASPLVGKPAALSTFPPVHSVWGSWGLHGGCGGVVPWAHEHDSPT